MCRNFSKQRQTILTLACVVRNLPASEARTSSCSCNNRNDNNDQFLVQNSQNSDNQLINYKAECNFNAEVGELWSALVAEGFFIMNLILKLVFVMQKIGGRGGTKRRKMLQSCHNIV